MDNAIKYSNDYTVVVGCEESFSGNIIIPEGVTSIKSWAFLNSFVKKITLPKSLLDIGEHAFDGCLKLESIFIQDGIKSIGEDAFVGCDNLREVHVTDITAWCKIKFYGDSSNCYANPLIYAERLYLYNTEITDLTIPEGVDEIGNSAFCNCKSLISVVFPKSLKKIGGYSFLWCGNLTSVTIQGNINYVGSSPFLWCCIKNVTIKEGVQIIPSYIFNQCTDLTELCLPKSVKYIKSCAFQDCINLRKVIIKNDKIEIDDFGFLKCDNINTIIMPHFNKNFLFTCFLECKKLRTIVVGEGGSQYERSVYDELLSKAQELKQMSLFYHNLGLNLTMVQGYYNNYFSYKEPMSWKDGMVLEELFYSEQKDSVILHQDWIHASGIGMALGWGCYRAIDIDNILKPEQMDTIVSSLLNVLGLPEDYEWVVKTGSQKGLHIIMRVKDFGDKYTNDRITYAYTSLNQLFERIEFRWRDHLMLPPSIHYSGNSYVFYNNRIPTTDVKFVKLKSIDLLLDKYCGDNYFKRYKWNDRGFVLVERRKVTSVSSDPNHTVNQNKGDSNKWLISSGTPQSYNSLAIRYTIGQGVPVNPKQALMYFQLANNDQSNFNIASLISVGFFDGTHDDIEHYFEIIDWNNLHYHNEINPNSTTLEEYIYEIRNQAKEYVSTDSNLCNAVIENPNALSTKQKCQTNNLKSHPQDEELYLFFDTETTGVPRNYKAPSSDIQNWPRLVQLAWILSDDKGNRIHLSSLIVRPDGFTIPADAAKVHGITTEVAMREGIPLSEAIDQFVEDLNTAKYIVGHNIAFDKKIVGAEMIRLGLKDIMDSKKSYCTMQSSIDFCKIPGKYGYKYPKLQELYKKLFGTEFDNAHDAMNDIEATEKCFWELRKRNLI